MKSISILFTATLLVVAPTEQAFAYLDPGTGSIILQGLLAVIAGTAVTLRLYWSKVKDFFGRGKTESGPQSDEHE
jgi:hypothetical protein